jgi:glycosyltransferase involved in cell wall biosynthesis
MLDTPPLTVIDHVAKSSRSGRQSTPLRVQIVHDYLTQEGGAERVVLAMSNAYPAAAVYTSLYQPQDTFADFQSRTINPSWLNRFEYLRADHRRALPLLATTFSRMRVPDADVVLCSSSGWAHGVSCEAPKVVYCYSPARWLYQSARYVGTSRTQRILLSALSPHLRRWDRKAVASASRYVTLSTAVRDQIRQSYGVDAAVIAPPLMFNPDGEHEPLESIEPGFLLCVSRLLPYKNVDALVAAMELLPESNLVVAGDGPLLDELRRQATPNVVVLGRVSEAQLRWLYQSCRVNLTASFEDFGLTPIEALAFGKPSIALRYGGFLDTVVEGETGLYFDRPDPREIAHAITEFENVYFNPTALANHLTRFSEKEFTRQLRAVVAEVA